jgi:hypothetical protein
MNEPGVEEYMTKTKSIGLFALTVIIGLANHNGDEHSH